MRSKGFCPSCARCVPKPLYVFLFIVLNLGLLGLSAMFIMNGMEALGSSAAKFMGNGLVHLHLGMGGALMLLGVYGLVAPYCCAGKSQDHVKCFVVFGTLVLLTMAVATVVTMLNVDNQDGITENLEFGWNHRYNDQAQRYIISNAQTVHNCCGFGKQQDRKVTPCPSAAKRGCEFRLRKEYTQHLNTLSNFEAMAVGATLLCVILGYCYAQHLDMEEAKNALNNNKGDQVFADDAFNAPLLGSNPNQPPLSSFNKGVRQRNAV